MTSSASTLVYLGILVMLVISGLITYFRWIFKYWKRKGLPFVKPSIPFGTMGDLFMAKVCYGEMIKKQYEVSKRRGLRHVGIFTMATPAYMPIELEYIKNIMSNDFAHFTDRGFYYNAQNDPLSGNLFTLEGSKWKKLRSKLTPTFSSLKLKMMFKMVLECGKHLTDAFNDIYKDGIAVDIRDLLERFSVDVIGCCAFGIDCNCFKERNSSFQKYGKRVFQLTTWESLKALFANSNRKLAQTLRVCSTPKDVSSFFTAIIKKTVEAREKDNVRRNDFLQILIDMKNNISNAERSITSAELAAQAYVFFLAGFETSSTTMSFCLYELAQNNKIQDRVRAEIHLVLRNHNGELGYDTIMDMQYLEQVVDETLRKYPPLPVFNRLCVIDYKIPGTDITLDKGTPIIVPAYGLQHDPDYFPNPEIFEPERFKKENKAQIKAFSYMPFGEGPRVCVGLRFGLLQVKVALILLLNKYQFFLNEKTRTPLRMSPYNYLLSSLEPIWLNIKKV